MELRLTSVSYDTFFTNKFIILTCMTGSRMSLESAPLVVTDGRCAGTQRLVCTGRPQAVCFRAENFQDLAKKES